MNETEEQLWNYIDGFCTEDERKAIEILLTSDANYRNKYAELKAFEANMPSLGIEEPSMGFTFKVMENIRAEQARVPLKTRINTGIIGAIGAFFICTILVLLGFVLVSVDWSAPSPVHLPEIKIPPVTNYLNPVVIKGFLFFDVVLGLFFLDQYFRKFFIRQK
ncbi:MAG: hypothetical protein V5804_08945 [Mucilaginibacter sp.]|uniref:hypothetical protein n=1 Tax=Mucilaginibacter sp. TaxID=1882438 RepID=UPI0034E48417